MENYRLSILAEDDLEGIFEYTYSHWGLEQACHYRDLIEGGLAELIADPERPKSKARDDLLTGCRFYRVQHHYLVYRVKNDVLEIGRVLHEQMNFEKHIAEKVFR